MFILILSKSLFSRLLQNLKRVCTILAQKVEELFLMLKESAVLGFQLFDSSLILRDEDRGKELFCAWPVVGVFREHPSNGIQDF